MSGAEVWRLQDGCNETGVIQGRACKEALRIPIFATNRAAELETERGSRRGKVGCWLSGCEILAKNLADK
jgi:hypothetical protein